jgi:hypothetical protein
MLLYSVFRLKQESERSAKNSVSFILLWTEHMRLIERLRCRYIVHILNLRAHGAVLNKLYKWWLSISAILFSHLLQRKAILKVNAERTVGKLGNSRN